jgi:hypothetical protein
MIAFHSAIRLALIVVSVLASSVSAAGPAPVLAARGAVPSAAATGNAQWDDRFGTPFGRRFDVLDGDELNAAVFQGELYVAGNFDERDTIAPWQGANSIYTIARWNGRRWDSVGIWSSSARISAMLVHDGSLYVAGTFSAAGGVPATNVARWDGVSWHALGDGIAVASSTYPMDMASWNGEIYVGGRLTTAGGGAASNVNVVRWDGAAWHALGDGLRSDQGTPAYARLTSLVATPGGLYAGGYFDHSGAQAMDGLARWDGAQWSAAIPGLHGLVTSLAWHGGQLYIAGSLSLSSDQSPAFSAIRWDGAQAQVVMAGLPAGVLGWTIRSVDGELYIATQNYLSRWDGAAWVQFGQPFQTNTYNHVLDMASYNNRLLVFGSMVRSASSAYGRSVLEWDGSDWRELGGGIKAGAFDGVTSLAVAGGNLYAASSMESLLVGGRMMRNLARWDGTAWADVSYDGAPYMIQITALAGAGSILYAAGSQYSPATSSTTYFVARLDGAVWTTLSTGFNGAINTLAWSDGVLYAGGNFTSVGTVPARGLARWDGAAWSDVYGGLLYNVKALAVQAGVVYASGTQDSAANGWPTAVVRGTAAGWSPLADVGALALALDSAGVLYAGGYFSAIGGIPAANVARWRNGAWEALGSGTNATVYALEFGSDSALYVGGAFYVAGGVYARRIARYDGAWAALGRGVEGGVQDLAFDGQDIYVGGSFLNAGDTVSENIALWHTLPVPNSAPRVNPDQAGGFRGQTIDITPLANDTDVDQDSLTIAGMTTPTHGSVLLVGTTVRYTPASDFVGTATFSYTVSDGAGHTASAPVSVAIANRAPEAFNDFKTIVRGQAVDIMVLDNDTDADHDTLTISGVTTPTHGVAQVVGAALRYTPASNFVGDVIFSYTISDGYGGTDSASMRITINNRAPQALADTATTAHEQAVDIAVLANDTDPDQDAITITDVIGSNHGSVQQVGTTVRYTPDSGFAGVDSFRYSVTDARNSTSWATVTVTVTNNAPQPVADTGATTSGQTLDVAVLANDSDLDLDPLTISGVGTPSHGVAQVVGAMVRYTPAAGFAGSDSFGYTVSDGYGGTASGVVTVTVAAPLTRIFLPMIAR